MSARLKAACVQLTAGRELGPNIEAASALVREAAGAGAELIVLPENCTLIEPVAAEALRKAPAEADHPGLTAFAALARETGAWILVGSLSVKLPSGKLANRSLLLDADGAVAARYDKIHRFDVRLRDDEWYRESDTIEAGSRAVLAPTPWGLMGLTVCYDIRFPYLYRALAQAGASFLTVPSAFTRTTGQAHWHVLNRARAIETGCWLLAAAQCGEHAEGRKTYGHSLIVDPWGEVVAEADEKPGVITAELDLDRVAAARRRIPSLKHDRAFEGPDVPAVEGGRAQG